MQDCYNYAAVLLDNSIVYQPLIIRLLDLSSSFASCQGVGDGTVLGFLAPVAIW